MFGKKKNTKEQKKRAPGRFLGGTLVRKIYQRVTLHYVGHVYALLMQEHKNDDAKVRALMKQSGRDDMVRKAR